MKIRIKENSIRFRLTKTEVASLCENGYFEQTTHMTPNTLVYAVQEKNIAEMEVNFSSNKILLSISDLKIKGWDKNETVGFETSVSSPSGHKLHLLLEKDFVCLDQRLEDQSDNYPNPKMESPFQNK